jgi:cytochrome c553
VRTFSIALLLVMSGLAYADEGAVLPEEFIFCTTCHGVQMMGNDALRAPRLSGMDAWYVAKQLRGFRAGWRGTHAHDVTGLEMLPMAMALSEKQIDAVARHVATTRSRLPERSLDGDPVAGESLYASCAACHGVNAEGKPELGSPALRGLNDWYIAEQLRKFRQRIRGSHPNDRFGQQMRAATDSLPDDKAIADVVAYITMLDNDKNPGDQRP